MGFDGADGRDLMATAAGEPGHPVDERLDQLGLGRPRRQGG